MKNKIIIFVLFFFVLIYSAFSLQENELSELDSIDTTITADIQIDIKEEMEKDFDILPENSYVLNLKNRSLAVFIESPVDDIIHYPSNETCTRFCAVKLADIKYMNINYFKKLTEKVTIKVTAIVNSASIISIKSESPQVSLIRPLTNIIINVFQVTQKNYFYADS